MTSTAERIEQARQRHRELVASRQDAARGVPRQPLAGEQETAAPEAYGPRRAETALALRQPGTVAARAGGGGGGQVDGDELLRYVRRFLGDMAVWPSEEALTLAAVWCVAAHARDGQGLPVWQYAARFLLVSDVGGSGKSWMAKLMGLLCPDSRQLIEPTKASLMSLMARQCTVILSEAEILFGTRRNAGIVAAVNAGWERGPAHTHRQGSKDVEIPLFGHVIIDGLDTLITATGNELKTLVSRCIVVPVRMAPEGYAPPRMDARARAVAGVLNARAARWMAQEVAAGIGDRIPQCPAWMGNRPRALAESLLAVAEAAGGIWPELVSDACTAVMSGSAPPAQAADEDGLLASYFGEVV